MSERDIFPWDSPAAGPSSPSGVPRGADHLDLAAKAMAEAARHLAQAAHALIPKAWWKEREPAYRAVKAFFVDRFPRVFLPDNPAPLARGIHGPLAEYYLAHAEDAVDLSPQQAAERVRLFLFFWCRRREYARSRARETPVMLDAKTGTWSDVDARPGGRDARPNSRASGEARGHASP